eukprot:CAMPEP_0204284012 /NCGR_PEP_ID=MMETSP0468-20130131/47544_1 /ASSEMBLY_ACC=CAM_ASM_000383 /TAXON_ID=2969 /ORGANISM="Oxyrrhis marina" /LENGTH=95 /DNA_ID=CAMNT_0051261703 /DNA_START=51 /DNA_END=335 /DNA_ORIENTATION=+
MAGLLNENGQCVVLKNTFLEFFSEEPEPLRRCVSAGCLSLGSSCSEADSPAKSTPEASVAEIVVEEIQMNAEAPVFVPQRKRGGGIRAMILGGLP